MRPDLGTRATRDAYDAVASSYATLLPDVTTEAPLDRAVLAAFVAMIEESGGGLAAEIGCGSGRVTAHLADAGLQIVGVDLSPGMAAVARAGHPHLGFAAGDAAALPIRSGALSGLVAWYSLINMPTAALPDVLAELARVTRPGAPVLVSFQSGDGQRVDRSTSYGKVVPLTYYRHRVEDVTEALARTELALHATISREPMRAHETTPQAFLLAQRR